MDFYNLHRIATQTVVLYATVFYTFFSSEFEPLIQLQLYLYVEAVIYGKAIIAVQSRFVTYGNRYQRYLVKNGH
jgi:hypothetical protein